jgi:hypothetical protein
MKHFNISQPRNHYDPRKFCFLIKSMIGTWSMFHHYFWFQLFTADANPIPELSQVGIIGYLAFFNPPLPLLCRTFLSKGKPHAGSGVPMLTVSRRQRELYPLLP